MKKYTFLLIGIVVVHGILFYPGTTISKKKPGDETLKTDLSMINLQSPSYESMLLFWEQNSGEGSNIFYKQITGSKVYKSENLTEGKGSFHAPAVDYTADYCLYVVFSESCKNAEFVVLVGRHVDPPLAEKKIKLNHAGNNTSYLPPGISTNFKKAVILTDGSSRVYSPDVAGDEHGAHIVWVSEKPGFPETSEIYYRYAGTDTSSGILQISDTDMRIDSDPVIARSTNGETYIFWSAYTKQ
ncbi:MAG: hypothetical protein A2161_09800 [Candidatus Schekmanbacteria bacterium RBG_13_48_7]|uniref:Uncharacterized protein n=1 Tax=Candidatus Schekmanbacteria bacterium RBG_13_48_7 TaxID=1817878 RepID=A0A1F7RNE1_9BACT|nr:MAG: hypothetical protein A2161_09800 [Candidatus Schekmanbacteria bacterium RBG_13_48_7]